MPRYLPDGFTAAGLFVASQYAIASQFTPHVKSWNRARLPRQSTAGAAYGSHAPVTVLAGGDEETGGDDVVADAVVGVADAVAERSVEGTAVVDGGETAFVVEGGATVVVGDFTTALVLASDVASAADRVAVVGGTLLAGEVETGGGIVIAKDADDDTAGVFDSEAAGSRSDGSRYCACRGAVVTESVTATESEVVAARAVGPAGGVDDVGSSELPGIATTFVADVDKTPTPPCMAAATPVIVVSTATTIPTTANTGDVSHPQRVALCTHTLP